MAWMSWKNLGRGKEREGMGSRFGVLQFSFACKARMKTSTKD
jgi:hypothetical protein